MPEGGWRAGDSHQAPADMVRTRMGCPWGFCSKETARCAVWKKNVMWAKLGGATEADPRRSGGEPGGLDHLAREEKIKGHFSYITNK